MKNFLPSSRPRLSREEILRRAVAAGHHVDPAHVTLIGLRGYYQETPAGNVRGIYDDALAILGPGHYSIWNANTDPGVHRRGIAVLKPGRWQYKPGIHNLSKPAARRYPAFVQAEEVTVLRDGTGPDTGWFGINIHRGGATTTSSLGCQTLPPAQWDEFHATLTAQLKSTGQKKFDYVLIG